MLHDARMFVIMRVPKTFNNCLSFERGFLAASNEVFYGRSKKERFWNGGSELVNHHLHF